MQVKFPSIEHSQFAISNEPIGSMFTCKLYRVHLYVDGPDTDPYVLFMPINLNDDGCAFCNGVANIIAFTHIATTLGKHIRGMGAPVSPLVQHVFNTPYVCTELMRDIADTYSALLTLYPTIDGLHSTIVNALQFDPVEYASSHKLVCANN